MKTENLVRLGVDAALKREQFLCKSSTWYRDLGETVLVVSVQKSNFGQQYYINLGVFVKTLSTNRGDDAPPKEADCHIRLRLESLIADERAQFERLLDLEDDTLGAAERQLRIEHAIEHIALPFLIRCGSVDGIHDMLRKGLLNDALVHKGVRDPSFSP